MGKATGQRCGAEINPLHFTWQRSKIRFLIQKNREEEKKMKWISLILVVMIAFVFGCGPTVLEGRKIDSGKFSQMTIGQTNKAKVEELFGKPAKTEMAPAGVEKYFYTYRETDPEWYTIESTQKQNFEVWFQNGILQYYKLRSEGQAAVLKE
jgi:hypothetical protein